MKILYLANFLEGTGWGQASLNNILALDSVGADLVLRPLSFNGAVRKVPDRIHELMARDISNIDVCIQHTLPTFYCYNGSYKNIGYYEAETNDYSSSMWPKHINLLDRAWVPTELNRKQAEVSGVSIPISVVNHCIDTDKYYNLVPSASVDELENSYNFCFVGELSKRKNIGAILRAFYSEFHPSENVGLFLKLNSPGLSDVQCMEKFTILDESIRRGMKYRQNYRAPSVITYFESYNNLLSIMSQCHCFVSASHGEAWCYPALEALALGLNVLYTADTGVEEFAMPPHSYAVKSHTVPCFGANETLPEIYSCRDSWQEIDVPSLMFGMRNMYEQRHNQDRKKIAQSISKFGYEEVGRQMLEALNA